MNFIEEWINHYGYKCTYKELPESGKKALQVYYEEELEVEMHPDMKFAFCEVPMRVLTAKIAEVNKEYSPFDEYHKKYMRLPVEDHGDSVCAIIIENSEDTTEVIYDGWHRFHSYYSKGLEIVPCVIPYIA